MKWLALFLFLVACGKNEPQQFEVNGELSSCTVIEKEDCGLTLACEGKGMIQCYSN
jgi:hypothetical protein